MINLKLRWVCSLICQFIKTFVFYNTQKGYEDFFVTLLCFFQVSPTGIEPVTNGLKVRCSTS